VTALARCLPACACLVLLAPAVHAQTVAHGWGPRVGFSSDPDQMVLGGQLVIGEIAPDITFDPSLEFGFGDDRTTIAVNFDGHYHFRVGGSGWRPYMGVGVGIIFEDRDGGDSDTNVAGGLILGTGVPTSAGNRFFSELKLGIGDAPSIKIMVGWNFRM